MSLCLSVCMYVCLSVCRISRKPQLQTSMFAHYPCMLVARSFTGEVAMRYTLPVLWMMPCLAITGPGRRDAAAAQHRCNVCTDLHPCCVGCKDWTSQSCTGVLGRSAQYTMFIHVAESSPHTPTHTSYCLGYDSWLARCRRVFACLC